MLFLATCGLAGKGESLVFDAGDSTLEVCIYHGGDFHLFISLIYLRFICFSFLEMVDFYELLYIWHCKNKHCVSITKVVSQG